MKHTAFSVKPSLEEDKEELPFYQKSIFKLAALLAIVAVVLLASVGFAIGFTGDTSQNDLPIPVITAQETNVPVEEPVVPAENNSQPLPLQNNDPQQPLLSDHVTAPPLVPSEVNQSLQPIWRRYWLAITVSAVILVVLAAAGVALAIHYENERVARELELALELERQLELERRQQELSYQLENIIGSETLEGRNIVNVLVWAYGISLLATLALAYYDYTKGWTLIFDTDHVRRYITYFVFFITLHGVAAAIMALCAFVVFIILEAMKSMPIESTGRLLGLLVIAMMHFICIALSVPTCLLALALYLSGSQPVRELYENIWINSWSWYNHVYST